MKRIESTVLTLIICLMGFFPLRAVTEVYNLRVTTITSEQIDLEKEGTDAAPATFTSKLVSRFRENKQGGEQLLIADMNNIVYSYKRWYARVDGGFGYVREKTATITTKHTQLDDLLLSVGYRHLLSKQLHLTYTLLGGIPTHKDTGFQFFQFGTGHYSVGGQFDAILHTAPYAYIGAFRWVHFFKAKADTRSTVGDKKLFSVNFALGELIDLVLAVYRKIRNNHSLEVGYNPTFNTNIKSCPPLDPLLPSSTIRNSWYSIYRYSFVAGDHPMGIGVSASYGFDITPHIPLAAKHNISGWVSYSISF